MFRWAWASTTSVVCSSPRAETTRALEVGSLFQPLHGAPSHSINMEILHLELIPVHPDEVVLTDLKNVNRGNVHSPYLDTLWIKYQVVRSGSPPAFGGANVHPQISRGVHKDL